MSVSPAHEYPSLLVFEGRRRSSWENALEPLACRKASSEIVALGRLNYLVHFLGTVFAVYQCSSHFNARVDSPTVPTQSVGGSVFVCRDGMKSFGFTGFGAIINRLLNRSW